MDLSQLWIRHMCIDLRGRDILVSEHLLDSTKICTTTKKICGEAVAQSMGRDLDGEASLLRVFFN